MALKAALRTRIRLDVQKITALRDKTGSVLGRFIVHRSAFIVSMTSMCRKLQQLAPRDWLRSVKVVAWGDSSSS